MTTFIGRLPTLLNPATEHRRLSSAPPSPDEADLAELHNRTTNAQPSKSDKRSSKGKGKEVDPTERGRQPRLDDMQDGQEVAEQELYPAGPEADDGTTSYPPTNEEQEETKRVQEVRVLRAPVRSCADGC